MAINDVLPLLA